MQVEEGRELVWRGEGKGGRGGFEERGEELVDRRREDELVEGFGGCNNVEQSSRAGCGWTRVRIRSGAESEGRRRRKRAYRGRGWEESASS